MKTLCLNFIMDKSCVITYRLHPPYIIKNHMHKIFLYQLYQIIHLLVVSRLELLRFWLFVWQSLHLAFYRGVHLKDLISLHTALPDRAEGGLLNFRKMAQLSSILRELTRLQGHDSVPVDANMDLVNTLRVSHCYILLFMVKIINIYLTISVS